MTVIASSDEKAHPQTPSRVWAGAAIALALFAPFAFFFLDRAVATFSYEVLRPWRSVFIAMTRLVEPLPTIGLIVLAFALIQFIRGRRIGPTAETLVRAAIALCVTIVAKDQLKYAFGRTWPETWINNNPSFFGNGTYGFFPFHGGQGWYAFPSGHTAMMCAVAAALWMQWPRGRPIYALGVILTVVGLLGADYHWVTDITVGGALGTAIGVAVARWGRHVAGA